jgi:hypothetical protein
MDDLVEGLELITAALHVSRRGHTGFVVGLRVLGRVDEQLAVAPHELVVIVVADGQQAAQGPETVTNGRWLVLHG